MRKHCKVHKLMSVLIIALMIVGMMPVMASADTGQFKVDWDNVGKMSGNETLQQWAVAKNNDGYYVYMELTEKNNNTQGSISIEYPDVENINGQLDPYKELRYFDWANGSVRNGHNGEINGASSNAKKENNVRKVECFVPKHYFPDENMIFSSGSNSVSSADIKNIDGSSAEPTESATKPTEPTTEPTQAAYEGIVIDGSFDDWEAVPKTDIDDGLDYSTVDQVAMVWDEDYIYLYFEAYGTKADWGGQYGNWNSVTGAGPSKNGKYAITTDLGYTVFVQLGNTNENPTVSGVSGADVAVNNTEYFGAPHKWEVVIPTSALKDKSTGLDKYKETISFGFYTMEPVIKDVANLHPVSNEKKDFTGIAYDGNYTDWAYYPHTYIQYGTSGTQEDVVDSEGALYSDGDTLYGHVVTTMPQHASMRGYSVTRGIQLKINDNIDYMFAPKFFTVDENGNIDWNCKKEGLENGTYEFCMTSLDVGQDGVTNIKQLKDAGLFFGKMKITVSGDRDECEWKMDVPTLANYLRHNAEGTNILTIDPSDIKTISVHYGELGDKWITTAGTSTGPIVGIILCFGVVGGVLLYRKKRLGKKAA